MPALESDPIICIDLTSNNNNNDNNIKSPVITSKHTSTSNKADVQLMMVHVLGVLLHVHVPIFKSSS